MKVKHQRRGKTGRKSRKTMGKKTRKQYGGSNACVIFILNRSSGFFSMFFFLCHAYLYAKKNGMPFFIEHDSWIYTSNKGWHDYFESLVIYDSKIHRFTDIKRYYHSNIESNVKFTTSEYISAINDIFKPLKYIQDIANTMVNDIKTFKSLFIRKGDKVEGPTKEMELINTQTILKDLQIEDDGYSIFVMTDDYRVIEEIQTHIKKSQIYTLTDKNDMGFYQAEFGNKDSNTIKKHVESLISSILIFIKGSPAWADYRSNTGRFLKLLSMNSVSLYPMNEVVNPIDDESIKPWHNFKSV